MRFYFTPFVSYEAVNLTTHRFKVTIATGSHLFPSRTEKLSPSAPMVLPLAGGRVGRCQLAPPDYFGSREAFLLAVFKGFVEAKPDLSASFLSHLAA